MTGLPVTIEVSAHELREALQEPLRGFVYTVRACLERTPPELAADIVDTGIILTGGGALLRGLDTALRAATHLPVRVGSEPAHCAVLGTGRALADPALLTAISVPP